MEASAEGRERVRRAFFGRPRARAHPRSPETVRCSRGGGPRRKADSRCRGLLPQTSPVRHPLPDQAAEAILSASSSVLTSHKYWKVSETIARARTGRPRPRLGQQALEPSASSDTPARAPGLGTGRSSRGRRVRTRAGERLRARGSDPRPRRARQDRSGVPVRLALRRSALASALEELRDAHRRDRVAVLVVQPVAERA